MSSLLNRLFQKSTTADDISVSSQDSDQEFLEHFYSQGFSSLKLDALKNKIAAVNFSPNPEQSSYELAQLYIEIEYYLTIQDAGFLGSKASLRDQLKEHFPEKANTKPFYVLYKEDNTQEIAVALLLADYLYTAACDYCGYISVLSPEFVLEKDLNLSQVAGNKVYYLSCRRKIREYIEKLSVEVYEACLKKGIENRYSTWYNQFTSFYKLLETSDKLEYYIPDTVTPDEAAQVTPTSIKNEVPIAPLEKVTTSTKPAISKEGQSLHEAMFENLLDKALVFDQSGKILLANESARDFFNISETADRLNLYDLLPSNTAKELKKDIADHTHKRERVILGKKTEIHLSKADGTIQYYEVSTSNNYTEGDDTYTITLKDITKKRDTLDTLSKEMEHVQRAAKAKSTFLSNMSHEIRTPLNVILGLADIIKKSDNVDADLFKKNIEGIDFSAKNLLSIVNDILDFSKIEAGKLSIQSYDYNLRKVITSLTDGFKTKARERGVDLITKIHKDIPDIVVGDQYRLNQILTNLVGNAMKFTSEGDIQVIARHKELSEDQIEVHFEVKDSGIGIPADRLDRIFDSFYQIEEAGNSKSKGTGLGLAITKELITLQNGELTATSIEGEGSSFCFTLPLAKSKLQSTEENVNTQKRSDKQLEGLRVLVAEDNTMNQFYIKQLLNRLGIDVDIAENGQEAVNIYNLKNKGHYNLILMDMHMPILGGVEAIEQIRHSHKDSIKKVPIVMCSADVFPESRKKAIKAGIDFYLTKPVDEDALKEVLFWLISDEDEHLEVTTSKIEEIHSSSVNLEKLRETFDNDDEFIITLLEVFIQETPDDFKSLTSCVEREFYSRASGLAHKMKSSFMNLGMTHQGHFLQQIEKNIHTADGFEIGKKYVEEFEKIYTKTLLDVNILLIELKRL